MLQAAPVSPLDLCLLHRRRGWGKNSNDILAQFYSECTACLKKIDEVIKEKKSYHVGICGWSYESEAAVEKVWRKEHNVT